MVTPWWACRPLRSCASRWRGAIGEAVDGRPRCLRAIAPRRSPARRGPAAGRVRRGAPAASGQPPDEADDRRAVGAGSHSVERMAARTTSEIIVTTPEGRLLGIVRRSDDRERLGGRARPSGRCRAGAAASDLHLDGARDGHRCRARPVAFGGSGDGREERIVRQDRSAGVAGRAARCWTCSMRRQRLASLSRSPSATASRATRSLRSWRSSAIRWSISPTWRWSRART